jgi:putative peptidoglycan lipid II flippase
MEAEAEAGMDAGAVAAAPRASAAALVAAGIFLSRIMGLVRERAVSYFFGLGPHADVLRVALKTPNFLQNLLGEGTISAAFIPLYSRMLEEGRPEAAGRFAGAVFGLLLAVVAATVGLGVLLARPLLTVLLPGWLNDDALVAAGTLPVDRFELAVATVRYTFPMAGVLVLFAWGLGVLNSHRRFFLPYVAPVLWNAAIIGGLVFAGFTYAGDPGAVGGMDGVPVGLSDRLLFAALVGALVGGVLQFAVLVPGVVRELRGFRLSFSTRVEGVRPALQAFVPVVLGRGAYQLSGYLDTFLAGFLAAGAIAAQNTALTLYLLPISLFGMSVAASELPELSRISREDLAGFLDRVRASLGQILFLVVPTAVGYLLFGYLVVGAFFQTGRFGVADTWLVALVLAAYSLGLVATTATRLLQNAFYALHDTRTPARIAVGRLAVSAAVGATLMLVLDRLTVEGILGMPSEGDALRLGAVGLALGASVGAWIELALLTHALRRHAPAFALPWRRTGEMVGVAVVAAVPSLLLRWVMPEEGLHVAAAALLVVGLYGVVYLGLGYVLRFEEGEAWTGRFLRQLRGRGTKDE